MIERITEAEAQAAEIKKAAALDARELAAQAEARRIKRADEARTAKNDALIIASEKAEREGAELASSIAAENARKADEACKAAEVNLDKAVSYILERVTK